MTSKMFLERDSGPYDVIYVDAFFCKVVECGDVPPARFVDYTWTRILETCWRVSGSVEVEIGTGLATKLIAELNVRISGEIGWSDCETTTDSLTMEYDWVPCYDLKLWKEKGTADVDGSVRVASSAAHWYARSNGNEYSSECGSVTEAVGSADTIRYIRFKNAQLPCCEDDGEICCGCIG